MNEENKLPNPAEEGMDKTIPVVKNKRFYIGLGGIILSFVLYFCLPLLFLLPYNVETIGGIIAIAYGVSWGIFTIAIAIMGKDGYIYIKDYLKKYYQRFKGYFVRKGV